MRLATLIAAPALIAALPASATSTILCTSPDRRDFEMYVSVGNGEGGGVDFVRIVDGGQELATGVEGTSPRIAASLVNTRTLRFQVAAARGGALVASLEARRGGTVAYVGTLRYRGRGWRVSCRWDEDW